MSTKIKALVVTGLIGLGVSFAVMAISTQNWLFTLLYLAILVVTSVTTVVFVRTSQMSRQPFAKGQSSFRQDWLPVIIGLSCRIFLPGGIVFCFLGIVDNVTKGQALFGLLWTVGIVACTVTMIMLWPHSNRLNRM